MSCQASITHKIFVMYVFYPGLHVIVYDKISCHQFPEIIIHSTSRFTGELHFLIDIQYDRKVKLFLLQVLYMLMNNVVY